MENEKESNFGPCDLRAGTRTTKTNGLQEIKVSSSGVAARVNRDGRVDLRIDLTGVPNGVGVYWHCAVWFFLCRRGRNLGRFPDWPTFRKALNSATGVRVDHVGGCPEVTDFTKLELSDRKKSERQGQQERRAYKTRGKRVLLQRRLHAEY